LSDFINLYSGEFVEQQQEEQEYNEEMLFKKVHQVISKRNVRTYKSLLNWIYIDAPYLATFVKENDLHFKTLCIKRNKK
jgi:hypothetical protein